jgi:small subunit ribosomal protein S5
MADRNPRAKRELPQRRGLHKRETAKGSRQTELEKSGMTRAEAERQRILENWVPKTEVGKIVRNGEITSLEDLWNRNLPILESEIIDTLIPNLEEKVVDTRKTTYVRRSGRKFNFSAAVLVGDKNKFIGFGIGSDKEKFPAIRKAVREAKLNMMPVKVGSGSWEDFSSTTKSVPFKVTGKCASVRVTLHPAPKGTGLVVGSNIQDVFRLAGITDVWGQTRGSSATKSNFVQAAYDALAQLNKVRMSPDMERKLTRIGGKT